MTKLKQMWMDSVLENTETNMNWQVVADAFAEKILDAVEDIVIESDDSPKMILMSPQREILSDIRTLFQK